MFAFRPRSLPLQGVCFEPPPCFFASAFSSADNVDAFTGPVIRIRPPVANSISMTPTLSAGDAPSVQERSMSRVMAGSMSDGKKKPGTVFEVEATASEGGCRGDG
jgi:hypothetical protein